MSAEIRLYDAAEALTLAPPAARLIAESWPVGSIDYSQEYLQWQLSFPSSPAPVAAAAWKHGSLVAFGAVTSRSAAIGPWRGGVAIKSFMTVAPAERGRGIGRLLRRTLLRRMSELGVPVVRFGDAGERNDEVLQEDYAQSGLVLRNVHHCSAYAARPSPPASDARFRVDELADGEDATFASSVTPDDVLYGRPEAAERAQLARDPWRRRRIGVRTDDGSLVLCAGLVNLRRRHAAKVAAVPTLLEMTARPGLDAAAVRALVDAVPRFGGTSSPSVVLSNFVGDPTSLSAVGIRGIPSQYDAYVASAAADHPSLRARRINLEIV